MHNFNHTIKCFSSKGYIYIKGGGRVEPGAGGGEVGGYRLRREPWSGPVSRLL